MNQYSVWMTLNVKHQYFELGKCGINLIPSLETWHSFKRLGLWYKQQDACTWLLLKSAPHSRFYSEENDTFLFHLKALSPYFQCFTKDDMGIDTTLSYSSEKSGKGGIWQNISFKINKLDLEKQHNIILNMQSKAKHLEFILIPKFRKLSATIKLLEESEAVLFDEPKMLQLPGFSLPVIQFLSAEKQTLKARYPYKIRLAEQLNNGEQVIYQRVRFPDPSSISPARASDTITSYIYY